MIVILIKDTHANVKFQQLLTLLQHNVVNISKHGRPRNHYVWICFHAFCCSPGWYLRVRSTARNGLHISQFHIGDVGIKMIQTEYQLPSVHLNMDYGVPVLGGSLSNYRS